jgi:excisionase family DNA binding protein
MTKTDNSAEEAKELAKDGAVSVKAAVEFTGVGRASLYAMMGNGELAYIKVGTRRLIPKAALVRMLAERMTCAES